MRSRQQRPFGHVILHLRDGHRLLADVAHRGFVAEGVRRQSVGMMNTTISSTAKIASILRLFSFIQRYMGFSGFGFRVSGFGCRARAA